MTVSYESAGSDAQLFPEADEAGKIKPYAGRYGWIGLFLLLLVSSITALVVYDGVSARKAFLSDQQTLARNAVSSGETQLLMLLNYLNSELELFALQHQAGIRQLQHKADAAAELTRLKQLLSKSLPDLQGLALAIPRNEQLLADNPDLLDYALDVKAADFVASVSTARVALHATEDEPNFHIMVLAPGLPGGVLIGLIDVMPLQRILANLAPPGHQLLIHQQDPNYPVSVSKDDLSLHETEGSDTHTFFSASIIGSNWQLSDRSAPGLLKSNSYQNIMQRGILLVLTLLAAMMVFQLLLKRHYEFLQAQEALLAANKQLRFSSLHDHLTGLPNRVLLEGRLQEKIANAGADDNHFLLMLVNLNEFNRINKNLGYTAGDEVLQQVSRRIKEMLPGADMVARFEGDVFAVISDIRNKSQASTLARKILDALERPIDVGDTPIKVTASVGVALFPDQGRDMQVLVWQADSAVTLAKTSGGRTVVFASDADIEGLDHMALIGGIKDAMRDGQLHMVYQPKLSLTEPDRQDFEALLRWQHKDYGALPADAYIPLIEQTRHIVDLTHWTIHMCFATQKKMHELGAEVSIAINLSARVLDEEGFPLWVEGMIKYYDLSPSSVRFELTESAMMHDSERAMQVLLHLAAIGVGLSVDDFGVGHSSLAYISRLPVDELKVDKSFVQNMLDWDSDRAIVKATVDLAHDLGLSVVAEGVETLEQATMLREMECDRLQGYFISYPLTAEQMENWVASKKGSALQDATS